MEHLNIKMISQVVLHDTQDGKKARTLQGRRASAGSLALFCMQWLSARGARKVTRKLETGRLVTVPD